MAPKQTQPFEMNRFVKGLVTEASPLSFPPDASVDEYNFDIELDGTRARRLGLTLEANNVANVTQYATSELENLAIQTYLWENVGEDSAASFTVVQIGNTVRLHSRENEILSTAAVASFTIGYDKTNKFSFASVDGDLVIANGEPDLYIAQWDANTNTVSLSNFYLQVRDQWGLEAIVDGNDLRSDNYINYRPTSTTSQHTYNLRNQSWGVPRAVKEFGEEPQDPLNKAHTQDGYGKWPANSDIMHEWTRPDPAADEQRVKFFQKDFRAEPPYSTAAPRGYFIIDALRRGTTRRLQYIANMNKFPELVEGIVTDEIPLDETPGGATVVAEYAGRIFYGGFSGTIQDGDKSSPRMSSYILYSQLVESIGDIGRCYQEGDPTSPDESDLVATDGGVIRISGMDQCIGMIALGRALFVIARNGVWMIQGGNEEGFSADNFEVVKITDHGPSSAASVVEVQDTFAYWTDNAIYHVVPNEVGQWQAKDISTGVIKQFYNTIPTKGKAGVKGFYDKYQRKIRWLYTRSVDDQNNPEQEELIYDLNHGAFIPYKIYNQVVAYCYSPRAYAEARPFQRVTTETQIVTSDDIVDSLGDPVVIGEETVEVTELVPTTKLLTVYGNAGTIEYSFAEYRNAQWKDWGTKDAAAYMTTGAFIGGDSSRDKQVEYLTFHMEKDFFYPDDEGINTTPCQPYACDAVAAAFNGSPNGDFWHLLDPSNTSIMPQFLDKATSNTDWQFELDPYGYQWFRNNGPYGWDDIGPDFGDYCAPYNTRHIMTAIPQNGDWPNTDIVGLDVGTYLPNFSVAWVDQGTNSSAADGAVTVPYIAFNGYAYTELNSTTSAGGQSWLSVRKKANYARIQCFRADLFEDFTTADGAVFGSGICYVARTWAVDKGYVVGDDTFYSTTPWNWMGDVHFEFSCIDVTDGTVLYTDKRVQTDVTFGQTFMPFKDGGATHIDTMPERKIQATGTPNNGTGYPFGIGFHGFNYALEVITSDTKTGVAVAPNENPGTVSTEDLAVLYARSHSDYVEPAYCTDLPPGAPGYGEALASGCLVTTGWDHAYATSTGRLSPQFQVYREVRGTDGAYSVVTTRNRIRGRGGSYWMRMDTEPGKGCRILGWNLALTGNTYV